MATTTVKTVPIVKKVPVQTPNGTVYRNTIVGQKLVSVNSVPEGITAVYGVQNVVKNPATGMVEAGEMGTPYSEVPTGNTVVYGPPATFNGVSSGNGSYDISVTPEMVDECISKLNRAATSMRDSWGNVKNNTLNTIRSSWVGPDCELYVSKIEEMDSNVENAVKALELLSNTYQKSQEELAAVQNKIKNAVGSL